MAHRDIECPKCGARYYFNLSNYPRITCAGYPDQPCGFLICAETLEDRVRYTDKPSFTHDDLIDCHLWLEKGYL